MLSEKEKLAALTELGTALNRVQDLDILLEKVLSEARRFVAADAGSIYLREGDRLRFICTQNETLQAALRPGEKLIYTSFHVTVGHGSIAGHVAASGELLNLPDVYTIGPTKPFSFSPAFDQASRYVTRSALTVPLKSVENQVLGVLQVINARDPGGSIAAFSGQDETIMLLFASIAAVALERAQLTRSILLRMIRMAQMRDPNETGAHANRVGSYAVEIYDGWATRHGVAAAEAEKQRDLLRMAAMLHDVGKVAVSDLILKKQGRLEKEEYETMKCHTVMGARLFGDGVSELDRVAATVALDHHEHWDGKGYPGHVDVVSGTPLPGYVRPDGQACGKRADEIDLFGRIVALADVFDALSSPRQYKAAWDEAAVLQCIREGAGRQFDPELVEIFFENMAMIRVIQKRYSDN